MKADPGRVWALSRSEVIQIVRDPMVLYMAVGLPALLVTLFGLAVSFDLDRLPLAVVDLDRSEASRSLAEAYWASGAFGPGPWSGDDAATERLFRRGEAKAALVLPRGCSKDAARGGVCQAQLVVDGSDATTAAAVLADASAVAAARAQAPAEPTSLSRVQVRFNPSLRSPWFVVPGLIAVILAMMAVLLPAVSMAREWERGKMELIFATPVSRLEIVLGKLGPYVALGIIQVFMVLTVSVIVFDLPMRGSRLLVLGCATTFLTGMVGQGLLLGLVSRSQFLATQAGIVTSMMPSILLSGFLSPVENLPSPLRALSMALPSRHFIDAMRGVLLRGAGLDETWRALAGMAAFAVVTIGAAALGFRRELE